MLKSTIANLGNSSAVTSLRRDQKVHQAIERRGILTPMDFKHAIRKKIQVRRQIQRHFYRYVFGIGEATDGRLALVVEPGRAFGTGHHESTRLALEWLEDVVRRVEEKLG